MLIKLFQTGTWIQFSLFLILLSGCSGGPSNPIQFKSNDFPAAPINIKAAIGDQSISLSWGHAEPSKVAKYLIFRQDSTSQNFQQVSSTDKFSFTDFNLNNGRQYRYRIASVGANDLQGKMSEVVSAVPAIFSVLIDTGLEYTNSPSVTLAFGAPRATTALVQISNDSTFENSQWENFTNSKPWSLTIGDGVKTVFVRFRDSQDVENLQPAIDQIILDTKATIRRFTHDALGKILTPTDTMHILLDAGEAGGQAIVVINNVQAGIVLFDNGTNGDSEADDGIYEFDYIIPTGPEVENTLVIGSFKDRAGNTASNLSSSSGRITVRRPPTAVKLIEVVPLARSSRALDLFWSRNGDFDFSNYRIFRSSTPGVSIQSPLVTIIQNQNTISYKDSTLVPNTTYYYRVFVYDVTGLFTSSNERNGTTNP